MKSTPTLNEALQPIVEAFADMLAERLNGQAKIQPGFCDARTSPLGRRAFLKAARSGAFPSYRVGRRILARLEDVDAWIRGKRRPIEISRDDDTDAALLRSAGIRLVKP